jgi:hypothetical protein
MKQRLTPLPTCPRRDLNSHANLMAGDFESKSTPNSSNDLAVSHSGDISIVVCGDTTRCLRNATAVATSLRVKPLDIGGAWTWGGRR